MTGTRSGVSIMGCSNIQECQVDEDGFSFGMTSLSGLFILSVAGVAFAVLGCMILLCGSIAIGLLVLGLAYVMLVKGGGRYLKGALQNEWMPSWRAEREGLLLQCEHSLATRWVPWSDVRSITLQEYYADRGSRFSRSHMQKDIAVIELRRVPEPLDWLEELAQRCPTLQRRPANVIIKSYCGVPQHEVAEWLGRLAPVTVAIEVPRGPMPEERAESLAKAPEPVVRCAGECVDRFEGVPADVYEEECLPASERLARWMPQNGAAEIPDLRVEET